MIKQLHLWQAILFISILGVCGCYVNEETAPSYFTPEGAYSASLSTILEFDSTSAFLQATAYVAPLNHSNDSEWDVNLNSTRLGYVPSSNSYSSNVIPPVANATLNWSLSKGSRSNLAELDIPSRNPSIPTTISLPNDTTVVLIDSPIVVKWIPDSSWEPVLWEVIDSSGHVGYQWQSHNTGSDTIYPYYGQYRPLVAGPAALIMWRDNNYQGYTDQFNYQVDAETRRTVHFRLQ